MTTATVAIVTLNVSVSQAATPSTLQQTGGFVSQGGTTQAKGTLVPYSTLANITDVLTQPVALSGLVWADEVVTATTAAPHGWTNADAIPLTIAGATPNGYNGTFTATVTGASTFTYPLTANPGMETVPGTVVLGAAAEILAMATTYFANQNPPAINILELGEGTVDEGVAGITTWLAANPLTVYAWLVPREWDGNESYEALALTYQAPNKLTYFFTTMVLADITDGATPYTGNKAVLGEGEASQNEGTTLPATEFSLAALFGQVLSLNPNSTNRVTPLSYVPLYAVTAYPTPGNQATFQELQNAFVGYVGTGAQGGLPSTNIAFKGMVQDGNQFLFWYSGDWFQINSQQALANEIINGSQPGGSPLYYAQNGINRLQNRLVQTAQTAVAAGLATGTVLATQLPTAQFQTNYNNGLYIGYIPINAEPLFVYAAANPNDYKIGKYAGFTAVYTPTLGFLNIFFNLNITNLLIP